MNLDSRYRVYRPALKARFPVDEDLIKRQRKAREALGDTEIKADRKKVETWELT